MFMIYIYSNFQMPTSNSSLIITSMPEDNYRLYNIEKGLSL